MVSDRHNTEAELEGFEKKFYDGVKRLVMVVCDATKATVEEMSYSHGEDEKVMQVTVILNTLEADEDSNVIEKYADTLCKHFSAFFTPIHYRPYMLSLIHI